MFAVLQGDSQEKLKEFADNSIDAVVCDPPYELAFMGKKWDSTGIAYSVSLWSEVLRVLKPGGYVLAFGGSRTYHRMACAIEDAGFEIRDSIDWMYGSGFPKSLDISKAIDKAAGAEREVVGRRTDGRYAHGFSEAAKKALGGVVAAESSGFSGEMGIVTAPATDAAREWSGWGTALKPAKEPIVVARKPLEGTVAGNVLKHGTGAINVDGCRVGTEEHSYRPAGTTRNANMVRIPDEKNGTAGDPVTVVGRWPANVLLTHSIDCVQVGTQEVAARVINRWDDGSKPFGGGAGHPFTTNQTSPDGKETIAVWNCVEGCPVRVMDEQSGTLTSGKPGRRRKTATSGSMAGDLGVLDRVEPGYPGSGGASRFFNQTEWDFDNDIDPFLYCKKTDKKERDAGLEAFEAKTSVEIVGRKGDSAGAQNPRAGAGRGAGAPIFTCSLCDLNLGDGRAATECPNAEDGKHVRVQTGTAPTRKNDHPTVKPIALMRWLVRLVTPPGGVVLDPFCGSGSTGCAAVLEGKNFIGVELDPRFVEIATARIEHWSKS